MRTRRARSIARRAAFLVACAIAMPVARGHEDSFDFTAVARLAAERAAHDYRPSDRDSVPPALRALDYDQYRRIRFDPAHALWREPEPPFELQFFHLGYLYVEPVRIHVIEDGTVRDIAFDTGAFTYDGVIDADSLPADLGFAGFRIEAPLNEPHVRDELIAFLGASYFRVLGKGQRYGLSARGLAVDTASPRGEEFPAFREFWIERPVPGAGTVRAFALLDSASVAGAYEFRIEPGDPTRVDVRVALFARREVDKIGLAPLTSMFFFGEERSRLVFDYRPEVHDSDALLLRRGEDDWTVRPLENPRGVHHVSSFVAEHVTGFGLLQRDREFEHYADLESRFDLRPSYWIEFVDGFDMGSIELVEIPTEDEVHDNVVAYFRPTARLEAGARLDARYTLFARRDEPPHAGIARVTSTRVDSRRGDRTALFVVEFAGAPLEGIAEGDLPVARIEGNGAEIRDVEVRADVPSAGLRVAFTCEASSDEAVELRLSLHVEHGLLPAETWVYRWQP